MFNKLLLAVALFVIIWLGFSSHPASSQQIESRLNNLQADFRRFESRLNQIESQLNQTRQSPSLRSSPPFSLTPRRSVSPTERDAMFDRLATLVVELKQQVNKLEARVSQLEPR
jgi:outer membrane murein-binding lipoprotein Lpp